MASGRNGRHIFSLGFMTGLMLTLFLRSEEGRRLRAKLQARANEVGEELGMHLRESIGPLAEDLDDVASQGQQIIGEVASAVKAEAGKSAKTASGMWGEWQASFRRGMAKAKGLEGPED